MKSESTLSTSTKVPQSASILTRMLRQAVWKKGQCVSATSGRWLLSFSMASMRPYSRIMLCVLSTALEVPVVPLVRMMTDSSSAERSTWASWSSAPSMSEARSSSSARGSPRTIMRLSLP